MTHSSRSALVALLLLAVVPWAVQPTGAGDLTAVMSWGLLNTNSWHVLPLPAYLGATQGFSTLPQSLQVWPLGLAFYCGAVASALGGVVFEREDVRVTVGLLALSGVGSAIVWWGLFSRGASGVIPVGVVATGIVIWWFYQPAFSAFVGDRQRGER